MFDHEGTAILPQQYLLVIEAMPRFKDIEIIGLPELIPAKHPDGAAAYCTLKLCIKDNAKGDARNRVVNKTVSFFGWPHRTLPWMHKPAILQCSSCMRWGHHVSACRSIYPFCAVCAGPHQTHSHEATSNACPFFKVHHNRRAITDLLDIIRSNKFHGFKSPFNSRDFTLAKIEVLASQIQSLSGAVIVTPDGASRPAPAMTGKKSKLAKSRAK